MDIKRRKVIALCLLCSMLLVLWPKSVRDVAFSGLRVPFTLLRHFLRVIIYLPRLPEFSGDNARLREALVRSQLEVAQLHESLRQTVHERQLLELAPAPEGIIARVIGRSPIPTQQVIIIDKGGLHSVELGAVAVDVYGVVGRVIEHAAEHASVLMITDSNSRIAAYVDRTRETGLLVGLGQGRCEMLYLDSNSNIEEGDEIYTAGLGGPFPKGLLLGRVLSVQRDAYLGTSQALIQPAADIQRIEEVYCFPPANTVTVM